MAPRVQSCAQSFPVFRLLPEQPWTWSSPTQLAVSEWIGRVELGVVSGLHAVRFVQEHTRHQAGTNQAGRTVSNDAKYRESDPMLEGRLRSEQLARGSASYSCQRKCVDAAKSRQLLQARSRSRISVVFVTSNEIERKQL